MTTQLYLIRHGEAIVNVEPIIGGMQGDRGLTPRGIAQAERLRDRLGSSTCDIRPDVLISSTLPRARQTAEIIAPALGLPITWSDEVQEIRVGDADGLTLEETRQRFGRTAFDDDPYQPIAPGGENWGQFMLRVSTALHHITRLYDTKTILIVCHGGFIDGSFAHFLTINTRRPTRLEFYPHNASLTHWGLYIHHHRFFWRLVCYNDTAHLADVGKQESPRWANINVE